MIPRFERAVCDYFTLGSACGDADCNAKTVKPIPVVPLASGAPRASGRKKCNGTVSHLALIGFARPSGLAPIRNEALCLLKRSNGDKAERSRV